jgi:DNA-binding NtrC family response regulator
MGKPVPVYRKELLQLLMAYDFPGNVRELQAMVFDAVAKCSSSRLSSELFSEKISREQGWPVFDTGAAGNLDFSGIVFERFPTLKQADEELIRKALEIAKGNQKIAGQLLGITRQALNNRLRRSHTNS